uniref:histone deacetylase n=2 Tax=Schistocephalus solidus TaxID=70667 RepID=A0A0X3P5Q6_SCHSO
MEPRIGIVYSNRLKELACLSPKYGHRFSLVMALIHAYKMTEHLVRIPPVNLTPDAELKYLSSFHSHDFLESLRLLDGYYADDADPDIPDDVMDSLEEYGLAYDCQGFPGVYDYALSAVRATLAAVDALLKRKCQVAINWAGGWHHGKRAEASGFCYLNDVVIGLNYLLSSAAFQDSRKRVIYLDFDLHHGDGVEEAFAYSSRVVTFSVHHASPGFFPGTGDITPDSSGFFTGARGGRYSCFNLPLGMCLEPFHTSPLLASAISKPLSPLLQLRVQVMRPGCRLSNPFSVHCMPPCSPPSLLSSAVLMASPQIRTASSI